MYDELIALVFVSIVATLAVLLPVIMSYKDSAESYRAALNAISETETDDAMTLKIMADMALGGRDADRRAGRG